MRSICFLVFLVVLFLSVNAGHVWLKDLISPKGWDLGYGVLLKLNESPKGRNVPIMDRLSLDLNLGDVVGVSVGKAPKSEGVELDFYVKKNVDYNEGRGNKKGNNGKHMIPIIIGYKAAILTSLAFGLMKLLTFKAIFLAKAALLISLFVLISKLKNNPHKEIIEFEQHSHPPLPYYIEKDQGFQGYEAFGHAGYGRDSSAQPSNVYQSFAPNSLADSAASESNTAYSSLTASDSASATIPVTLARHSQNNNLEKRRDSGYYRQARAFNSDKYQT